MSKSIIVFSLILISFCNCHAQIRKYYLDYFQDPKIIQSNTLTEISFLLVKEENIPSFKKFKIKFSFPENIRLYNKIRKEGRNYGALMPSIYLGKTDNTTNEFHYTNKRNGIYDNKKFLEFKYKKDITNTIPVNIYFYAVPFLSGQGRITAEFSWVDGLGNKYSEVKESGIIRSTAPPVSIQLDKSNAGYYNLIGELEYKYDYRDTIPSNSDWNYELISLDGQKYSMDSPKIEFNKIPAGNYTAKGEVKFKNTTWSFDKKNIEIKNSGVIIASTTTNPCKFNYKNLLAEAYLFLKLQPYKSKWHTVDFGIKFLSFKLNPKFTIDLFDISVLTNFYRGFSVTNTIRVNYNFTNGLSLFYGNGFGFTTYPDYKIPRVVYSGILESNEIGVGYELSSKLKVYLKAFMTMTKENSGPKYDGLFMGISQKF